MLSRKKPYEGLFITLEGGDGCGKSTLAEKLVKELEKKGYQVLKTREPGGTPLSENLRGLLLNKDSKFNIGEKAELLLFLAARVQHIEEVILPALRDRKVVICERFNDSTVAYQGCGRHIGASLTEQICNLACDNLEPDITLFLDVDPEIGLKRVCADKHALDRLEQEKLQFHREVRSAYLHLADKYSNRIVVIDAEQPEEEVFAAALKVVDSHLVLKP